MLQKAGPEPQKLREMLPRQQADASFERSKVCAVLCSMLYHSNFGMKLRAKFRSLMGQRGFFGVPLFSLLDLEFLLCEIRKCCVTRAKSYYRSSADRKAYRQRHLGKIVEPC
eukprot:2967739-Pyramimonas_sp.AAC.1